MELYSQTGRIILKVVLSKVGRLRKRIPIGMDDGTDHKLEDVVH